MILFKRKMGDTLRGALGISTAWTERERELYSQIASEKLGPVYMVKGIPKDQPSERARYLDEKLDIKDHGEIEEKILKICKKSNNKALALKELEKIAVKIFI